MDEPCIRLPWNPKELGNTMTQSQLRMMNGNLVGLDAAQVNNQGQPPGIQFGMMLRSFRQLMLEQTAGRLGRDGLPRGPMGKAVMATTVAMILNLPCQSNYGNDGQTVNEVSMPTWGFGPQEMFGQALGRYLPKLGPDPGGSGLVVSGPTGFLEQRWGVASPAMSLRIHRLPCRFQAVKRWRTSGNFLAINSLRRLIAPVEAHDVRDGNIPISRGHGIGGC